MTWAASADKHGIQHEDALHAIRNASYIESEFDEPRIPGRVRPTLFIRTATPARRPVVGGHGGSGAAA